MKSDSPTYTPLAIEQKWQVTWDKEKIYQPNLDTAKKPYYTLMMFPYPSAEGMHVGNMYAFTGSDVYGRFMRMQGYDVLEPIGLDGFGIHSENYALKIGTHPMEQAAVSEKNFYRQLHAIGNGFDWSRTVETYHPNYYKWTQWLFAQLFKAGLAYRKKAEVNFCPSCKTVLADEQVIDGKCERCSSDVEKKQLEQWFFKITDYAERLLHNIETLDWTEKVKIAQRQWIGRSEGARITFHVTDKKETIDVFTTRPDTLYGATFLVLSPEHPLVALLNKKDVTSYVTYAKKKSDQERTSEGKEKTGVFSGLSAINPVNNEQLPIWIADYVLMGYGTGAIMAVPAHDERDYEFAKKYDLPIKHVIRPNEGESDSVYTGTGDIINSAEWNSLSYPKDKAHILTSLEEKGIGKREVTYHLRDWLISRQRYWGAPIPMIQCDSCATSGKGEQASMPGWYAVPENELPVVLPHIKNYKPLGSGESPLASEESFYKAVCPGCGKDARRETDVSDTFLDSAWYFLRYTATEMEERIFDTERIKKWLPVDMYIGGAEHSVLHLLYARFMTMVLHDLKLIAFEEPFTRFFAHGLLIKEGSKMSKSKGNVVIPDQYIKKFGADTLRCYLMFLGPFNQGGDFYDTGIEGMHRFLKRVWTLVTTKNDMKRLHTKESQRMMHKTIKKATEDISSLRYNTAIASLMEWYNSLAKQEAVSQEEVQVLLHLLAPFAPHMTEELYQEYVRKEKGGYESIHHAAWPVYNESYLHEDNVTIVIQINGKVRDNIVVTSDVAKSQADVEQLARTSEKVQHYLSVGKVRNVIYVSGKILNFVI